MNKLVTYIKDSIADLYPQDEALALALWVAEEVTGLTRSQLLTTTIDKDTKYIPNIEKIVQRLRNFEPIQYIFGYTEWRGLRLKVTPATLIPRPETAELVDIISNHISIVSSDIHIIDIGTGTGCIAIALQHLYPNATITAIDISKDALAVAEYNCHANNAAVKLFRQDIFAPLREELLAQPFDIVVSNPPYICVSEDVGNNVGNYEPAEALYVSDANPLKFYERIAGLKLGTWLIFEVNERLASQVRDILVFYGYTDTDIIADTYGKERFVSGRLIQKS